MKRRRFIKEAGLVSGTLFAMPVACNTKAGEEYDFPLIDLHVHMTEQFTIDRMVEISKQSKVKFGMLEHPLPRTGIVTDTDLMNYIEKLRKYPVYIGLQPTKTGWAKNFSPEVLQKLDYVLMDPQTIPLGNGQYEFIWQLETYVEDTEAFMERYMAHSLNILNNEPINIFGWPLFLPVCIARDYYTIWTNERMLKIIDAAKARNIALEINDMAHTPHEEFIYMAKEKGLKFTFGSDARNANAGRLEYCIAIAKKCNLKKEDFFVPRRKI